MKIEVFEHKSANTETLEVGKDEWSGLMLYGRNVARLYDAFAAGGGEEKGVLTWAEAVERHRFVDGVYEKAGVVA